MVKNVGTSSLHSFKRFPWVRNTSYKSRDEGGTARLMLNRPTAFPTMKEDETPFPRRAIAEKPWHSPERLPPSWAARQYALKQKFPQGFNPPKKVSREAMTIIRRMQKTNPEEFSTEHLSRVFKISSESVRRILKSKWQPSDAKLAKESMKRKAHLHDIHRDKKEIDEVLEVEDLVDRRKKGSRNGDE